MSIRSLGALLVLSQILMTPSVAFAGDQPQAVSILVDNLFFFTPDGLQTQGAFSANGFIYDAGSSAEVVSFQGSTSHISRTLTSIANPADTISVQIEGNFVVATKNPNVLPEVMGDCTAPPTPAGTFVFPHTGVWSITGGTGKYAGLQGVGSWITYVFRDLNSGKPVLAHECLSGAAHWTGR